MSEDKAYYGRSLSKLLHLGNETKKIVIDISPEEIKTLENLLNKIKKAHTDK